MFVHVLYTMTDRFVEGVEETVKPKRLNERTWIITSITVHETAGNACIVTCAIGDSSGRGESDE